MKGPHRPLVIGVHGILSLGVGSTDLLLKELNGLGHRTLDIDHGWKPAIFAGITARYYARKLIEQLKDECSVNVVAHSFGARIILEAMRMGQRFENIYLFNAAIPNDVYFPEWAYAHITVVANPGDKILTYGKNLLRLLGYGDLGRVGYQGISHRVTTHLSTPPDVTSFAQHGHAFRPESLRHWAKRISEEITQEAA
jgi:pimeloyl-ACP methyl ester carboxylesterase